MPDSKVKDCMIVRYGERSFYEAQEIADSFNGHSVVIPDENLPPDHVDFRCYARDSAEWLAVRPS
jgi:hypothetical protein